MKRGPSAQACVAAVLVTLGLGLVLLAREYDPGACQAVADRHRVVGETCGPFYQCPDCLIGSGHYVDWMACADAKCDNRGIGDHCWFRPSPESPIRDYEAERTKTSNNGEKCVPADTGKQGTCENNPDQKRPCVSNVYLCTCMGAPVKCERSPFLQTFSYVFNQLPCLGP